MEIRIDTTKDSKEEIKRIIRFLESLVEESREEPKFPTGDNIFGNILDQAAVPGELPKIPQSEETTKAQKKEKTSSGGLITY